MSYDKLIFFDLNFITGDILICYLNLRLRVLSFHFCLTVFNDDFNFIFCDSYYIKLNFVVVVVVVVV